MNDEFSNKEDIEKVNRKYVSFRDRLDYIKNNLEIIS